MTTWALVFISSSPLLFAYHSLSPNSPPGTIVDSAAVLNAILIFPDFGSEMIGGNDTRLFVYASASCQERLKPISTATEKMARLLKLDFEVRLIDKAFTPIYVYYEKGEDDPIPIYCDYSETDAEEVYTSLRSMIFVLSFHPKHMALKHLRQNIMQSS
jgi:hypothetical protein